MDLQEPKLPEFYSPGRVFLSAFAAGAAIAAQKTRLEQNLMELDLRRRQEDLAQQNHQDNYRLNLAQLAETQRYHTAEIGNQAAIQKRLNDAAIAQNNADALEADRLTGLTQKMAEINSTLKPGTEAYGAAFNNAQLEYSDVWSTPAAKRVWGAYAAKHSAGAGVLTQSLSKAQSEYASAIRNARAQVDPRYFNYPDMWTPKTDNGQESMFLGVDDKGEPIKMDKGQIPKGQKVSTWLTLPKGQYDTIQGLRQKAYQLESETKPDLSALPQGMAPNTRAKTIPVVQTEQDYMNVPSGEPYVDPNGVTRRKP